MAPPMFSLLMGFCLLFFSMPSHVVDMAPNPDSPFSKTVSDLKESIVKGLGFAPEDVSISGFESRNVMVGHSVAYEFDIQIGNKIIPLKLLEDVKEWDHFDMSAYQDGDSLRQGEENGLIGRLNSQSVMPVLAPFQLEGPVELWIQDGKDMRLSLPHDVEAGVLKKVVLQGGAVVTVKGARSVSLRHPLTFPLPLNRTDDGRRLSVLSRRLKHSSRGGEAPISFRIVGPTSLNSPSSPRKLKLKRLAPGLVELSLPRNSTTTTEPALPIVDLQEQEDDGAEAARVVTPAHISTLWPLASVNSSDERVLGFEAIISAILGGKRGGSFTLLKANVSAQTFVKMGVVVEKKVREGDGVDMSRLPEWRTKPDKVRMHFEVVGKVEGDKLVPERVSQVHPVTVEDSVAWNVLTGNATMSTTSSAFYPFPNPLTI